MEKLVCYDYEIKKYFDNDSFLIVQIKISKIDDKRYFGHLVIKDNDGYYEFETNKDNLFLEEKECLLFLVKIGIRYLHFYPSEFMLEFITSYENNKGKSNNESIMH